MTHRRSQTYLHIGLALAFVLALGALAGCSGSKQSSSTTPATTAAAASGSAKAAYTLAAAAVTTMAPDGKLLVAQSADAISPTSTPSWQFLIGSPKSNVIYAVMVQDGKAQASEYGKAALGAEEWATVPDISKWVVDNAEAHDKALMVYPNGKNQLYVMGFVTYIPKGAKATTKPMNWVISFNPASLGTAATSTVNVDLTTGDTALAK